MDKLVMTYSELSSMRECRRRHELSYVRLLKPKRTSTKLAVGTIGHEALATYFLSQESKQALATFDSKLEEEIKRIKSISSDANVDELSVSAYATRAALRHYLELQGPEDLKRYEVIEVERTFEVPVLHPKAFYAGKIDLIVKDRHLGVLGIFDHKFLSAFDSNVNLLALDIQITLYCYATGRLFDEFPAIAIYNVIKKPKIKKKDGESLTDYEERVYSHLQKKIDDKKVMPFVRTSITRGPNDFAIAEQELYEAIRDRRRKSFNFRNVGMHCSWKCAFKEICFHENAMLVEEMFEKRSTPHEELVQEPSLLDIKV
jgi:hypothetical protein